MLVGLVTNDITELMATAPEVLCEDWPGPGTINELIKPVDAVEFIEIVENFEVVLAGIMLVTMLQDDVDRLCSSRRDSEIYISVVDDILCRGARHRQNGDVG